MVKSNQISRQILYAFVAIALIVTVVSTSLSQRTKPAASKAIPSSGGSTSAVIKTTKENITIPEFEEAYRRLNERDPYSISLDSLKDFLVIYGDYRLKLLDAKAQGLDSDPKIIKEMDGYRQMLAGPFILDKMLSEPAIKQMFQRRLTEIKAAHFLAMVKNWNDPKDTLKAYNRAMKALQMLRGGETLASIVMSQHDRDFSEDMIKAIRKDQQIAREKTPVDSNAWQGSDDKASIKEGGSLGWFTGGQTIRPFEDGAYSLVPLQFTQAPVRTKFGYHIIQLIDKRPRVGGIKVHHILVAMMRTIEGDDTLKYYQRIDSLYKAIKAGAKFEDVARASSDDHSSGEKGGDLDFIDHDQRRAERPFDEAAYDMKDGEMSGIIKTSKGYHIVRRDGVVLLKSFEEEKDFLKKVYKNYYFNEDRDKLLASAKMQHGARIDNSTINIFMTRIDSSRTSVDSNWASKFTLGEKALTIYEIGGNKWTIKNFIDSLNGQPGYPLARNAIVDLVNRQVDDQALAILSKDVSKKFPEFDRIMADYQNGIVLFELENRRVWSQVKPDSAAEIKFYNDHKSRFMWSERIDLSEIYVLNDSLAKAIYKRIVNGENFDSLARQYTERPGYKAKAGRWGLLVKGENEMSNKAFALGVDDVSQPFSFQAGLSIAKINRRVPITQKSFVEARQEVASQYQDEASNDLRLKWVEGLRKQYKREVNFKVLEDSYIRHQAMMKTSGSIN